MVLKPGEGQLVEVKNQSQVLVAEYSYNGLGYRTGWHYDVDGDASVEANTAGNTDDPWFQFVYDARWRVTATYRASHYSGWTIDANPKEQFVYNMAGVAGSGGSSYIDSVILRDRDANTNWEDQADATLEERVYYCQNWRADVIALMTDAGQLINQVRYDPYGKPFGISKADLEADGDVDTADYTLFNTYYSAGTMPFADWNWDGTTNTTDVIAYLNDKNADTAIGRGALGYAYSHVGGASRKGYAGYEIDPVLTGSEGWESIYHVRNRVYLSQLGRWTRRNPTGYREDELHNLYNYGGDAPYRNVDPTGLPVCPGGKLVCEEDPGDNVSTPDECSKSYGSSPLLCALCCSGRFKGDPTGYKSCITWCAIKAPGKRKNRSECGDICNLPGRKGMLTCDGQSNGASPDYCICHDRIRDLFPLSDQDFQNWVATCTEIHESVNAACSSCQDGEIEWDGSSNCCEAKALAAEISCVSMIPCESDICRGYKNQLLGVLRQNLQEEIRDCIKGILPS